jgi:putative hydrolase of the HAD superfamily
VIRAVLFDLDGTLYDRDAAMLAIAREQYEVFKDRLRGGEDAFVARLLELDDHGYAPRPGLYLRLALEYGEDDGLAAELERHFRARYGRRLDVADDTWRTLRALRSAGKALGVITNGPTIWQQGKLDTLGMGAFFDVVLISESEGVAKPDRRIFHRAVERLGVAPGEAMYVGDHPQIDVAGARAAGLAAVWKRVPYWELTVADALVVDALSEIVMYV